MQFIQMHQATCRLSALLKACSVTSSSYYRWKHAEAEAEAEVSAKNSRQSADPFIDEVVRKSWKGSRGSYGSPGIVTDLNEQGIHCGRKRVMRSMKRLGLQGRCNRRKTPRTTDSQHNNRISANLLKDRAFPDKPRQVLVSDTTYVRTDQGWHYLATVMDLCTREILGWSFSNHNDQQLVCRALWKAADKLGPLTAEAIHHSDRGSTYTSDAYLQTLQDLKLSSSMSAKGYCYDNAHMESFFGSLKTECEQLDQNNSPEETRLLLFDYIEGFYNTHRIHTALGTSPRKFMLAVNSH